MSAPVSAKQRQSQLNLSAAIEGALSNPVSGDRGGFTPSCLVVFSESQTERDSFISFFQRSSYTVNSAANVAQRSPILQNRILHTARIATGQGYSQQRTDFALVESNAQ